MCVCSHTRSNRSSRVWRWTSELAHRWPYLVFIGFWLIASDGWAQGPLRRLSGRVREAIQTGGPLAPPPATGAPAAAGQAPAGQTAAGSRAAAAAGSASSAASRFPSLRANAAATASTAGARPMGPSANYQRAATANGQSPNRSYAATPSAAMPSPAIPNSRLLQPRAAATTPYAAPASTRASALARQESSEPNVGPNEFRNLEVAKLGLKVREETVATVSNQSGRPPRGVLVTAVLVGSGGDAAGLKSGDRVLAVNGRLVNQAELLVDSVDQITPGEPIELKFNRDGKLYSTVGLASGPTGKLDREEFALVREQAREMLGQVAATEGELPAAKNQPVGDGSAIGGLGKTLGGWFGAAVGTAKPAASPEAATSTEPTAPIGNASTADDPTAEPGVRDVDATGETAAPRYKSLRPRVNAVAAPNVAPTDPPSLDGADSVLVDDSLQASEETSNTEMLPAPKPVNDATTIQQLLQEIRLLRERVQQLEVERSTEVR